MKETGDPREYEAFVREIDESRYAIEKDMVPRGVIPKRRGMSLSKSIAMEGVFPFPGFAPRLLASLVASSTAACTSGVVTVTATAHGITATVFDEWEFYYPGSPSLAAGFYSGFSRTGVHTCTFRAPLSADFASESVNAGEVFTSEVTFVSADIPAKLLSVGNQIEVPFYRHSNNTTGSKTTRAKIGSETLSSIANSSTTAVIGTSSLAAFVVSPTLAYGHSSISGIMTGTISSAAIDINAAQVLSVSGMLSAAAMTLGMIIPSFKVT